MLHLLYAVCEELRQVRCWTQLKRKHTFATVGTVSQYALPADFYAPLPRTHWNTDETIRLNGPEADDEFSGRLYGAEPSSANFTYRIFGRDENTNGTLGQVELSPTPSSAIDCAFEYVSRSFLLPKNWTTSTAFAASAYCNASGHIYQTAAGGTTGATIPSHTTGSVSDGAVTWTYVSAAYETIIADTDLVVFDDDLVKLGLRAKWMEEKGGDYAAAADEFAAKIDKAVSRYRGAYIGSMCRPRWTGPRYHLPYRGWSL
jgi:hypothetical protein